MASEQNIERWTAELELLNGTDLQARDRAQDVLETIQDEAIIDVLLTFAATQHPGLINGRFCRVLVRVLMRFAQDQNSLVTERTTDIAELVLAMYSETKRKRQRLIIQLLEQLGPAITAPIAQYVHANGTNVDRTPLVALLASVQGNKDEEEAIVQALLSFLEHEEQRIKIQALQALGQRKQAMIFAPLYAHIQALNPRQHNGRDEHLQQFQHEAALCISRLGEGAREAIPTLAKWLKDGHLGDQHAALAALGHIGTPDAIALIMPYLQLPEEADKTSKKNYRGKLQKSAVKALQTVATPEMLDRIAALFLNNEAQEYAWHTVADAIADMVTKGLDVTTGFAWVRTLLQAEPNERLWYLLCVLVNQWPEVEREMLIDYVQGHISHWDDGLRLAAYNIRDPHRYWRTWWGDAQQSTTQPCWSMVRSVSLQLSYHSPGGWIALLQRDECHQLTELLLHNAELGEKQMTLLATAPLPKLRKVVIKRLATTYTILDRILWNASWLSQLVTFEIEELKHLYYNSENIAPEYRGIGLHFGEQEPDPTQHPKLTPAFLSADPRVAHLSLTLPAYSHR